MQNKYLQLVSPANKSPKSAIELTQFPGNNVYNSFRNEI